MCVLAVAAGAKTRNRAADVLAISVCVFAAVIGSGGNKVISIETKLMNWECRV